MTNSNISFVSTKANHNSNCVVVDAPTTSNLYSILLWEADVAGEEIARNVTLSTAIQVLRGVEATPGERSCQVFSLAWGHGVVVTLETGGAATKHFKGSDCYGFGGKVPEDARYMEDVLNGLLSPIKSEYDFSGMVRWLGLYLEDTATQVDQWHTSNGEVEDSGQLLLDQTDYGVKEIMKLLATKTCGTQEFLFALYEMSLRDENGLQDNEVAWQLILEIQKVTGRDIGKEYNDELWATWRLAVGLGSGFTPYSAIERLMENNDWAKLYTLPCPPDRGEEEWYGEANLYERGIDGIVESIYRKRRG